MLPHVVPSEYQSVHDGRQQHGCPAGFPPFLPFFSSWKLAPHMLPPLGDNRGIVREEEEEDEAAVLLVAPQQLALLHPIFQWNRHSPSCRLVQHEVRLVCL